MLRKFQIGDIVEFEVADGRDSPRWDNNVDRGGSDIWKTGKVVSMSRSTGSDEEYITVEYILESGKITNWMFPNTEDTRVLSRPGWIRMFGYKVFDVRCECGSEKVYGKNNAFHSAWCAKATR
jgi:hypothetical protein